MPSVPMMSTSQALGSRLLLIMLMTVQGTMPKNSSIEVQHWTALMSVRCLHPAVDDSAQLGHLDQRGFGDVAGGDVRLDGRACLHRSSSSFKALDAAEDSHRSSVSTVMPLFSSSFSL